MSSGAQSEENRQVEPSGDRSGSMYADVLNVAAPIAELESAFDVEMALSSLLGGAYTAAKAARERAVTDFTDRFVSYVEERRSPVARALLAGLAVVSPTEGAAAARRSDQALAEAGLQGPSWLDHLGQVSCTGTWLARDSYGDQTQYVATFAYADPDQGGPEHAVCVLADHNLNLAKDLLVVAPGSEIVSGWERAAADDREIIFSALDAATLRAEAEGFLARTDGLSQPPSTDNYAEGWAIARARLASLPSTDSPSVAVPPAPAQRAALVDDFLSSPEAEELGVAGPGHQVLAACVRAAVDYAADENSGDPLRWSPTAVELFLVDWAPRQTEFDSEAAAWLPEVLAGYVRYAGRHRELSEVAVSATLATISELAPRYAERVAAGGFDEPVETILRRLVDDGVDPTNEDEVREWIVAHRAQQAHE